ncbi:MAG TPA: hypothetical protein ENN06_00645 [Desulfobacteraceae bacterium]|nr:hypothetical protein [Desulfobacteraceae bacterium]
MKNTLLIAAVVLWLSGPGNLAADECLEGDCDNGFGSGFTEDNKIYEGEWKHGVPHGQGKLFWSKEKIIEGKWENGRLIEEKSGGKVQDADRKEERPKLPVDPG